MIPSIFRRSFHCLTVHHVVVLNAVSKNAGQNDGPHQLSVDFLGNLWKSSDIEEVPRPHLHFRPRCSRVPLENRLEKTMMKSVNDKKIHTDQVKTSDSSNRTYFHSSKIRHAVNHNRRPQHFPQWNVNPE